MTPRLFLILICFLTGIASCQKEISDEPGQPGSGNNTGTEIVRIQQGTDPDINNDTVLLISYTSTKKIRQIVDSLYEDTIVVEYDASDRAIRTKTNYGQNASYVYDAAGLLTQISYVVAGSKERVTYEYTNGNVSKANYTSDLNSGGAYVPVGYDVFTVAGGNITEVKLYANNGTLIGQVALTYGSESNLFKDLSLFNYGNQLGMDQIVNFYTYFNKNISSGIRIGNLSFKTTNTFSNKRLTKITSENFSGAGGVYTWMFSY